MNLMDSMPLYEADCEDFSVFRIEDTPWDRRSPEELWRFVFREGLSDEILDTYGDEEQIRHDLEDLPEHEALTMIERFIESHDLTDRFNEHMTC